MSGALEDIARDRLRAERVKKYLDELIEYLKHPCEENYKKLEEAAEEADRVIRGYWTGPTHLKKGLKERVEKLKKEDKKEWAKLLASIFPISFETIHFKKLKELSPFKDKTLILVDYGAGFVSVYVENLEGMIDNKLDKEDYKIYDSDKYILVIDNIKESIKNAEIIWIGCGILGINWPRNREGEKRNF